MTPKGWEETIMTDSWEKIIRQGAPEVPDSRLAHRTNRALMMERMRRDLPRRKRSYRLQVATGGLAMVIFFTGQVSDVGSDAWDFEIREITHAGGKTDQVFDREFGNGTVNAGSEDQARDIFINKMIRDGEVLKAVGLEVHGQVQWYLIAEVMADGEPVKTNWETKNPPTQSNPDHAKIIMNGLYREILQARKSQPCQYSRAMKLDEFNFEMKTWVFEDTPFGVVKYHHGTPIR
jgi:hypothetical protein